MSNQPHVLVIEDDPPMQFFLRSLLEDNDLSVTVCGTVKEGTLHAASQSPDLILLDEPTTGLDPIGTREMKDLILAQESVDIDL